MADYHAQTRSNYFKVKNEAAFREWAASRKLEVWEGDGKNAGHFAICSADSDERGWCRTIYDKANGEHIEVDFEQELAPHLQDGSVAVLMEIGNEKLRYLHGVAIAVNSRGETEKVDLDDIYKKAVRLGDKITEAFF